MAKAKIKLRSQDVKELDKSCNEIKSIATRAGVEVKGPITLPTKKFLISTRKTPCGDGSDTYEKWELRVHKRLISIGADDRVLREVMRVKFPESIHLEIELE